MRKLKNSELNRKTINDFKLAPKNPFLIVLDNVRSLNNVGSIFRTADCLLAEAVYLCGITATPPHREIHKTALGATESVAWKYFDTAAEAVSELKNSGYTMVGIEQVDTSVKLNKFMPEVNTRYALVFGHEVKGVSQQVIDECDFCIEIPQEGTKHSYNVAVSAGIVMWEVYRKLRSL